jgi:hypothetical protein
VAQGKGKSPKKRGGKDSRRKPLKSYTLNPQLVELGKNLPVHEVKTHLVVLQPWWKRYSEQITANLLSNAFWAAIGFWFALWAGNALPTPPSDVDLAKPVICVPSAPTEIRNPDQDQQVCEYQYDGSISYTRAPASGRR